MKNRSLCTAAGWIVAALLSSCGHKAPPLEEKSIQQDLTIIEAFSKGLTQIAPETGTLWILTPPPLPERPSDQTRIKNLIQIANQNLPGWEIEVKYPSSDDLRLYESALYTGDYPLPLLKNLTQNAPPTALLCFKGIPVGNRQDLIAFSQTTLLAGVAPYGKIQANPLLNDHILKIALVLESGTVSWASAGRKITWQTL
ncbi:hypothetical protein P3T73_17680 [Kiritimatiellota bacterium B12222]|nr:hypothetical protein P3T73_17680 [Kiritimatiellota bacterium B12222]